MPLLNRNKSKAKKAEVEEQEQEAEVQYIGYDEDIDPELEGSVAYVDALSNQPVVVDTSDVNEAIHVEMAAMEESFQKQWNEYKASSASKYSDDKQDTTDNVLDNVVEIGVSEDCIDPCDEPESSKGDSSMAVPAEIHEQNLARLAGAGAQAHEHFVQFGKILDLSYEQDRKMVSLVESLGVREVTSQAGQTGIPLAGGRAQ